MHEKRVWKYSKDLGHVRKFLENFGKVFGKRSEFFGKCSEFFGKFLEMIANCEKMVVFVAVVLMAFPHISYNHVKYL